MEFLRRKNYIDFNLQASGITTKAVLTLDFLEPTNFILVELIMNGKIQIL